MKKKDKDSRRASLIYNSLKHHLKKSSFNLKNPLGLSHKELSKQIMPPLKSEAKQIDYKQFSSSNTILNKLSNIK